MTENGLEPVTAGLADANVVVSSFMSTFSEAAAGVVGGGLKAGLRVSVTSSNAAFEDSIRSATFASEQEEYLSAEGLFDEDAIAAAGEATVGEEVLDTLLVVALDFMR